MGNPEIHYLQFAILPSCHLAILQFAVLPSCHLAILPSCHPALCTNCTLPSCHRFWGLLWRKRPPRVMNRHSPGHVLLLLTGGERRKQKQMMIPKISPPKKRQRWIRRSARRRMRIRWWRSRDHTNEKAPRSKWWWSHWKVTRVPESSQADCRQKQMPQDHLCQKAQRVENACMLAAAGTCRLGRGWLAVFVWRIVEGWLCFSFHHCI